MASARSRLLSWPVVAAIAVVVVLLALVGAKLVGGGEDLTATDKAFAEVCRAHGGTPAFAPGSGNYVKDARDCTIEYGGDEYEMYAVHPTGFSAREAAQARQACDRLLAQRRHDAKTSAEAAAIHVVWHPRAGICESQP
jgi:hypothetical protein